MRWTATSLLLLCSCLTPQEVETNFDARLPTIIGATKAAVTPMIDKRLDGVDKLIEDGDDAVRKEQEEYHHNSKDERLRMESKNDGQHAILRGTIDRNTADDVAREAYRAKLFVETLGELRGRDTAINDRVGNQRAMLIANIAQANNALAAIRNLERTDKIAEKRQDAADAKFEKDWDAMAERIAEGNKADRAENWAKEKADLWQFWREAGAWVVAIAGIITILGGAVAWFRRKKK